MDERTVTLHADNLFSKWGFRDGDLFKEIVDELVEEGLIDPHLWAVAHDGTDKHSPQDVALLKAVKKFLLPALKSRVKVHLCWTHNPVRAYKLNGKKDYYDELGWLFTEEHVQVEVPVEQIKKWIVRQYKKDMKGKA